MYIQQNVKNQMKSEYEIQTLEGARYTHTRTHKQNVASSSGLPVVLMQKSLDVGAGRAGIAPVRRRRYGGTDVCVKPSVKV